MQRRSFLGSLLALFSPAPSVPGPFKRPTAPHLPRAAVAQNSIGRWTHGPVSPDAIGRDLTPRACVEWYGIYGGSFGPLYPVDATRVFDTPSGT